MENYVSNLKKEISEINEAITKFVNNGKSKIISKSDNHSLIRMTIELDKKMKELKRCERVKEFDDRYEKILPTLEKLQDEISPIELTGVYEYDANQAVQREVKRFDAIYEIVRLYSISKIDNLRARDENENIYKNIQERIKIILGEERLKHIDEWIGNRTYYDVSTGEIKIIETDEGKHKLGDVREDKISPGDKRIVLAEMCGGDVGDISRLADLHEKIKDVMDVYSSTRQDIYLEEIGQKTGLISKMEQHLKILEYIQENNLTEAQRDMLEKYKIYLESGEEEKTSGKFNKWYKEKGIKIADLDDLLKKLGINRVKDLAEDIIDKIDIALIEGTVIDNKKKSIIEAILEWLLKDDEYKEKCVDNVKKEELKGTLKGILEKPLEREKLFEHKKKKYNNAKKRSQMLERRNRSHATGVGKEDQTTAQKPAPKTGANKGDQAPETAAEASQGAQTPETAVGVSKGDQIPKQPTDKHPRPTSQRI